MPSILVLEPDLGIQRLLGVLLSRDGFTTRFVRDGRAGVRAVTEQNFAALIVDISIWPSTLERGSRRGLGFLHWLQKNRPGALRRVIALSALADREIAAVLPPVRCFLHKPFSIDELRGAVEECVGEDARYLTGSRTQ
jgi:CheY-like chemotaxis protein